MVAYEIRCTLQRQILEDTNDYTCRNSVYYCLALSTADNDRFNYCNCVEFRNNVIVSL